MTPKVKDLASREGRRPTWEMALIYPDQGGWTVDDYLRLDIGRHVEFSSGTVEFQPMPDERHRAIVFFLVQALKAYASAHGGKATMAPFPLRLWEEKFREPDVAGIPEYWIVDPDQGTITVLTLKKRKYAVHGRFRKGQEAVSRALPGFRAGVAEALEAE